jgi:hypothetical protein
MKNLARIGMYVAGAAAGLYLALCFPFVSLREHVAAQSTDSTVYVKAFNYPGATVGQMVAKAQSTCNPNTSIICILVIDPSLAVDAPGTMPTLCSQCVLVDYRTGLPYAGAANCTPSNIVGGVDAGAKILACASELTGGGVIDATGFRGSQTVSENILAGMNSGTLLAMGGAKFTFTTPQSIRSNNISVIGGYGGGVTNWVVGFGSGDFVTIPDGGSYGNYNVFKGLTITPGVTRTLGNIFNLGGGNNAFESLTITDPLNAFFMQNLGLSVFRDIAVNTTKSGTLNYCMFLYGTLIDNTFDNIKCTTNFNTTDSFLHIRNRVSGQRFDHIDLIQSGGTTGTAALVADCDAGNSRSTSIATGVACTDAYTASPTNRPELLRFSQLYIETDNSAPGLDITGCQDCRFDTSYISGTTNALHLTGESTDVAITNSLLYTCNLSCVYDDATSAAGTGHTALLLDSDTIGAPGGKSYGNYYDVDIAKNVSDVVIKGSRIGQSMFNNLGAYEKYGIVLEGGNSNITITGNDMQMWSQVRAAIYANTTLGSNNFFRDNSSNVATSIPITFTPGTGAGTGGKSTCDTADGVTCDDERGVVKLVVGTSAPSGGDLFTVNFVSSRNSNIVCTFQNMSGGSITIGQDPSAFAAKTAKAYGFSIASSTTYKIGYTCPQ